MPELPAFDVRLAQAGLVVDPQTARIPVEFGASSYAIEAHETADGCLLRCDVESPGISLARYTAALNQLGRGEPGTTEVIVAHNRLTVVRHLQRATSDDLRRAARLLAGMTQTAEEIVATLRTADAAEERLAKAPAGKFQNLQPAIDALGTLAPAGAISSPVPQPAAISAQMQPVTVAPSQFQWPYSPDGRWLWNGSQWVAVPAAERPPTPGGLPTVATRYAGFWIRFVAYIIDSIIVTASLLVLLRVTKAMLVQCPGTAIYVGCPGGLTFLQPQFWLIMALAVLYNPVLWGLGGTLGQRVLGLRVLGVTSGVRVGIGCGFLRLLGYILASIPIFLGLFWIGWDARKQGWHDKIAGTVVVHKVKP